MPKAPVALKKDGRLDSKPGPSSGSSSTKAPKRKKGGRGNGTEAIAVYSTLDEAMEAGVDAEENGERWSVGYKAQKAYETALSLYKQATRLDASSADAFYNVARVQFLVATSFYLPPACFQTLADSITSYKQSLSLAPPLPETATSSDSSLPLPSPFTLDVLYNLGVSLQTLAELIEEIGPQDLSISTGVDMPSSRDLLSEAALTFEQVSRGQAAVLEAQQNDDKECTLSEDSLESQDDEGAVTQDEQMDEDEHDDDDADNGSEGKVSAFTSSLITPATHLETLYSLCTVAVTALSGSNDLNSPAFLDSIDLLNSTLSRAKEVARLNQSEGEKMSADNEWMERLTDFKFADLSSKVTQVAKLSELREINDNLPWPDSQGVEVESQLTTLENEVLKECEDMLDSQEDQSSRNKLRDNHFKVQLLCDLGDSAMSLARLRMREFKLLSQSSPPSRPLWILQRCWDLSLKCNQCFNTAVRALDTSKNAGAVVLGAANTSTQTSRTRASISNNLAALSLLRADEVLSDLSTDCLGFVSPQARRNLFDSARIWSRRSLNENGLGWILTFLSGSTANSAQIPTTPCREASSHPHSPGGWETLRNESDCIMTFLRVLYSKRKALLENRLPLAKNMKPETLSREDIARKISEEIKVTEAEIQSLSFVVWSLIRRKDDSGAWALSFMSKPSEEEVIQGVEINRFLDDLISEEGRTALGDEERKFWNDWFVGIRNDVWSGVEL